MKNFVNPELQNLVDQLFAWSLSTFGPSEDGYDCAAHLIKEAEEAKNTPNDVLCF